MQVCLPSSLLQQPPNGGKRTWRVQRLCRAATSDDGGGGTAVAGEGGVRDRRARARGARTARLDRLRSVGSRLDDLHRQMTRLEAHRGIKGEGELVAGSAFESTGAPGRNVEDQENRVGQND